MSTRKQSFPSHLFVLKQNTARVSLLEQSQPRQERIVAKNRQDTQQILQRIKDNAWRLEGRGKTSPVFPTVKEILLQAVTGFPANTKLPTIRAVASVLGVTPVPVQRAINALGETGAVYSRQKSGVFVGTSSQPPAATLAKVVALPVDMTDFQAHFTFATDSSMPFQRKFWAKLASDFNRSMPSSLLNMAYYDYRQGDPEQYDLLEVNQWRKSATTWGEKFLDLSETDLDLPTHLLKNQDGPSWLPIHFRSQFLFYNRDMLQSNGISLPDYTDIEGQMRYCAAIARGAHKAGLPEKPYMTYYPISIWGRTSEWFQRCLRSDKDAEAMGLFRTAVSRLRLFYEQTTFTPETNASSPVDIRQDFISGTAPFYWGSSSDFWYFDAIDLPFNWAIHPCLNVDGSLCKFPVYGAVRRDSPSPIECVRFLKFLLTPAVQRQFMATGAFSVDDATVDLPRFEGDQGWLQTMLQKAVPTDFKQGKEAYVDKNILNAEFWSAAIGKISWEQAVDNAFRYARYYLQRR
jgi:hypothetical protein